MQKLNVKNAFSKEAIPIFEMGLLIVHVNVIQFTWLITAVSPLCSNIFDNLDTPSKKIII